MAAKCMKKAWGYILHRFLYWGKCLINDVGNGPHHLMVILYDAFYVTTCQHQYIMYWHGNVGRNSVTGKNGGHVTKTRGLGNAYAGADRSALVYPENTITHTN